MKFYNIFVCILIVSQSISAFNVKVLLTKFTRETLEKSPVILKSSTGFFVHESGKEKQMLQDSSIKLSLKNGELYLGDNKISDQPVSIRPQFPVQQKKQIKHLVNEWIALIKNQVEQDFQDLILFCNNLVIKKPDKNSMQSEKLEIFFLQKLDQFCDYLVQKKNSSQDIKTELKLSAKKEVYATSKNIFIRQVSESTLSKKDYYKLENNEQFRRSFFLKIIFNCLSELATKFLYSLDYHEAKTVIAESLHGIEYDKKTFWGSLYILRDGDNFLIINCLDIDDYLISVLQAEAWPGWPLEVYKSLIIASRSYLVSKILEAVRSKRLFHIKNTISHQSYKGYAKAHKNILKAAQETRDTVMVFDGKVVEAMFDACCGGIIPAKISDFSFEKVPYLARTKACTFCKPCWIYNWRSIFTEAELLIKLQKEFSDLKKIREIKVVQRDQAKLVKKVEIFDGKKRYHVTGKKMYSLFPEIKSFCFEIKKKNKQFCIQGQGYGHHIGLCQWGACKMVEAHWNHLAILKFYYPGVEFMQLSYL